MEYITQTAEETKEIGRRLSASVKETGGIFALSGDLGAGKTTFVQGFAEGLGISSRINSPTFIIVRTYDAGNRKLYHVDLYRLEDNIESEIEQLGLKEAMNNERDIILIEWAEKIKDLLPKRTKWIKFENLELDKRKITIEQ